MTRYIAEARSLFTFEFHITVDGEEVGWVRHRAFHPGGEADLNATPAQIRRVAMGEWTIEQAGSILATLRRLGLAGNRFNLSWSTGELELRTPLFAFRTDLVAGGETVGRVAHLSRLTRAVVVEAPEDLPIAAVALVVWHTIRRRRRAAGAAAGGG